MRSVLVIDLKSLPTWHHDLAAGFREHGLAADVFETTPRTVGERLEKSLRGTKWFRSPRVLARLVAQCRRQQPDLIVFLGMFVLPRQTVETLRRNLAVMPRLAGWVCDCFREPQFADWVAADHVFYFDTFLEDVVPRYGSAPMTFLPLAAAPSRYRPLGTPPSDQRLLFVGNVSPNRQALLDAIAPRVPVAVYGPNAPGHGRDRRRKLDSDTINALYNAHRVVLNINQSPNTEHGANLRVFEATASGALLLTQACHDLARLYRDGEEILTWRDHAELQARYEAALSQPERCRAIAAAGRRRTLAEHTFGARAATILGALA